MMWIPKSQRDEKKRVDSPIPTQAVSNEEFLPRPQTRKQRKWEQLIGELSEEKSRKLGMERRDIEIDEYRTVIDEHIQRRKIEGPDTGEGVGNH